MESGLSSPNKLTAAALRLAKSSVLRSAGRAALVGLGVMVIAFTLIRFIPGDPVLVLLGDQATPESVAQYRAILGLSGSVLDQFVEYVKGLVRGDLGISLATRQTVSAMVGRRLPVTLWMIGRSE